VEPETVNPLVQMGLMHLHMSSCASTIAFKRCHSSRLASKNMCMPECPIRAGLSKVSPSLLMGASISEWIANCILSTKWLTDRHEPQSRSYCKMESGCCTREGLRLIRWMLTGTASLTHSSL